MPSFYKIFVTIQTTEKIVQKQALSLLIRLFLCYFLHRMDIRCCLTAISSPYPGGLRGLSGHLFKIVYRHFSQIVV